MNLGEYVKKYREENKLSQRQFALKCNLSNGFISMVENNTNPKTKQPITLSLNSMKRIADGMNLSIDELIENTDDLPIMLSDMYDKNALKWLNDVDNWLNQNMGWNEKEKTATISDDGLSLKKRALIETILRMEDSDIDVVSAAADALIVRREK